jgi:hypothetical protein
MWKKQLSGAFSRKDLGKVWRGTYSYLERSDMDAIRVRGDPRAGQYTDHNFINKEPIQTMKMYLTSAERRRLSNPLLFEAFLKSLTPYQKYNMTPQHSPKVARTAEMIRGGSFPFEGVGRFDVITSNATVLTGNRLGRRRFLCSWLDQPTTTPEWHPRLRAIHYDEVFSRQPWRC